MKRTSRPAPKPRGGRPPAGLDGVPSSSYRRTTLYLDPETAGLLRGLTVLLDQPIWRVVREAMQRTVDALPPEERRMVRAIGEKRASRAA